VTLIQDVDKMRRDLERVADTVEANGRLVAAHELQISGDRGISETLINLAREIRSLRRAAYWVAGIIVAGAVTFAFSVLTLLGHS
jgi:hypothetical protein